MGKQHNERNVRSTRRSLRLLFKKGEGERGDTLIEALTAILIGGLSLLMLAQAMASASSIVKSSETHMDSYYERASDMTKGDAGNTGSTTLTLTEGDTTLHVGAEESPLSVTWYRYQIPNQDGFVVCYE